MGVAPAPELGRVSSNPPGRHAGNIDNKELVAGSTLYIPVFAPGALFEIGDGHAAQGDGEVDQTAIETSLRGRLQLTVRKGMKLNLPARGDGDRLHQHGHRPGSHEGDDDGDSGDGRFPRGHEEADASTRRISSSASPATSRSRSSSTSRTIGVHVRMPKSIFK